ncbi:MAG: transposase [Thermodesulfobacteriota bacterium]
MPRLARLDAPGLLQHVMARGIERTKIFRDEKDRKSFVERFAGVLESTQTQCYAWALIPNHFHALLRTGVVPLSKVMRRFMTGYAVTFNKRHKRSGHLFQNRYKSVVCEEDPYLLELIRYIHLNPLRAGLVKDLKELDRYRWAGHSAILGRRKNPLIPHQQKAPDRREGPDEPTKPLAEKTIEDVLLHFGQTKKVARRRYREFVEKGIEQGRRPDLQGGGLIRSAGGDKKGFIGRKKEDREKGDARILGSGDFVDETLHQAEATLEKKYLPKRPIEELVEIVASHLDLNTERIISASRKKTISEARALICHFAINDLSYSASEVARSLAISRVNAGRCAERGKKDLDRYADLKDVTQ